MTEDPIHDLLDTILRAMLNTPEELEIKRVEQTDKIVYYVYTKPGEEGLIIGAKGTLANAVRNIIKVVAMRLAMTKYVYLDIVNTKAESF